MVFRNTLQIIWLLLRLFYRRKKISSVKFRKPSIEYDSHSKVFDVFVLINRIKKLKEREIVTIYVE
ncbi:hypothetical protein Ahy_A10g049523 isoform B [Arachis hypogaea]|uniref:Uncharacterized protein n=1 Tax=Arachis hypogaea TaxID=3818 RepID=A0A445B7C8_ARAHY|nr:hypothetical protein Ahy_A10g049523 isoform B [Arachis hypogaea]